MKTDARTEYLTRDSILKLLSDEEVAKVSMAETAVRLLEGDEYLDLEQLEQGVRRAGGAATPMGRVLPKNAVHANTWNKILMVLATPIA
jgi:predicted transcriptional regulator